VSPCAPSHRARHLPGKDSGVVTCPEAPSTAPVGKGLRCRHVPRGTKRATRQERAPESPCASRLQACPLCRKAPTSPCDRGTRTIARQGSGIAMCPMAPYPPPGAGGLQSSHVSSSPRPPSMPVHSQDA
jgi:hypothetical protein